MNAPLVDEVEDEDEGVCLFVEVDAEVEGFWFVVEDVKRVVVDVRIGVLVDDVVLGALVSTLR